jgi:hypothetical protein
LGDGFHIQSFLVRSGRRQRSARGPPEVRQREGQVSPGHMIPARLDGDHVGRFWSLCG